MLNRSRENNLYCSIIATLQSPLEMTVHFLKTLLLPLISCLSQLIRYQKNAYLMLYHFTWYNSDSNIINIHVTA